jgi:PAS domain S-box-containing protein
MSLSLPLRAGLNGRLEMAWDDGERLVYRGLRQGADGEQTAVLAVVPAAEPPMSDGLDRLMHEYDLKPELDRAWAVRPLELVRDRGRAILVLEDPGGQPLELLLGSPMAVGQFLPLAIAIAEALAKLHRRGLIHKDIKPANILVDRVSGRVRLTGFGIACRVSGEHTTPAPPQTIAGTLAYMAPEQTGRVNRHVDARSDLYALGVTFYRMLTGVLPFTAEDAAELVHCHIALRPAPPDQRVPRLPAAISAIVMRLLAKTSEERYQTAAGVAADLRRCLGEWEATGTVGPFAPGAHDIPEALRISNELYGREQEVRALRAAFERAVACGIPELVLVSGYSGIGKSAVINELKAVVSSRGLFASGKFDQHKRDIPYTTLAQAFQDLTQQLLVRTDDELAAWREAMARALGMHGRLVVDIVPELELLIGPQAPVPDLPPREAENRLLGVLGGFLGVFARTHPLVLLLDDLQWLDAATLKFLAHILTQPNGGRLLVIGAYRDNEVGPAHPLLLTLESVRQAGGKVTEIALGPLSRDDLCRMIADAAGSETRDLEEFARLVQTKTAGNPFFAIQFLKALWQERLFTFDAARGAWTWDIHDIQSRGFTDNVIDLMAGKLRRLPAATQEVLQLFACVGNSADVATLAMTRGRTEPAVHADLGDAVREELVIRRGDSYQFLHDRVQEAAYALIPEDRRPEAHVRIGRLLLSQLLEDATQERVFEVVHQLNRGAALITDSSEKEQLKQLNALAGRRAKNAIAYASARFYLTQATALLGPDAWTAQYEDTFALLMERCECEYLTGNFQAAEDLSVAILENAGSALDRAQINRLRLRQSESAGRYEDALFVMRDALRLFGITVPDSDEGMQAATETEARDIAINLQGRRVSDLADAPTAADPTAKAIISLIAESMSHDHVTARWLPFLAAKGVNICLRHGNTGESSVVYDGYARALVGAGDFQSAFEFSDMALHLAAKFDNPRLQTLVLERRAFFVNHWRHHFETSLQYINQCFDAYVKLGDFYACYAAFHLVEISIERGCPLDDLLKTCRNYADFAAQSYNDALLDTLRVQQQFIACMAGRTREPTGIDDGGFQAERLATLAVRRYHVLKQQLLFHFGRYDEALEYAERAATALRWRDNLLICATHRFYRALTLAELYPRAPAVRQQEFRQILSEELLRHRNWADNCPENFANRHALLAAEVARIDGQDLEAMRCYERAIRSARDNGFVQNEALANELAGRFHLDQGLETSGYAHLRNARAAYAEWGAGAKVAQLEQRYPHLAAPEDHRPASIGAAVQQMDVTAVVRASQVVSSEIVLPNLVEQLMRIALQNAGADRGLLVLTQGDAYYIAAEAHASGDRVEVRLCHLTIDASCCPDSLIRYVIRTHKSVILDDTSRAGLFSDDDYLQERRPKAVLCVPLVKQGRLAGLLYLENTLTTHVFTSDRAAVLELLAAQAAISLENTRLYSDVQAREAKIRRLVDSNIIGIVIGDSVGHISEANDAFLDILGYSRDDVNSGRVRWPDLTPPEWRLPTERAITELKEIGTSKPFEKEYIRKDGRRVPVLVGVATLDDTPEKSVAFVLDLTARKRAEQELRDGEEQWRAVFENNPTMYFMVDAAGTIDSVNPFGAKQLGYTVDQLVGRSVLEVSHEADRAAVQRNFAFCFEELGRTMKWECRKVRRDATVLWARETARAMLIKQRPVLLVVCEDISDGKQAEYLTRQVFESSPDGIAVIGRDYRYRRVNPVYERTWGIPADHIVGMHVAELRGVADFEQAIKLRLDRCFAAEERSYAEWFTPPIGRRYTAVTYSPLRPHLDWVEAALVIHHDLTEHELASEALREAQAELAHMNRVTTMGQLTATIAHEVSQPIAAAVTNAEAALRWLGARPPDLREARQALGRIVKDGNRAGDVIGRIRALIKKAPPRRDPVDMNEAILEVIALTRTEMLRNGVVLQTGLATNLQLIRGDRVQLEQVILNLIVNAIDAMKGVDEGSRELAVTSEIEASEGVRIAVRDSGLGLTPECIERVFEAFYTTKPGGMGMGLSICRSMIEAHGGRMWATQNVHRGAAFHFTLPARQSME